MNSESNISNGETAKVTPISSLREDEEDIPDIPKQMPPEVMELLIENDVEIELAFEGERSFIMNMNGNIEDDIQADLVDEIFGKELREKAERQEIPLNHIVTDMMSFWIIRDRIALNLTVISRDLKKILMSKSKE